MKSQLHYLSASHCAAPVTFGSELPGVRTVCAVLPISLTKVKQLRTSTLGYVIATPLPFRVSLLRAGDLRFTVAGDAYRLRRTAYIIDQGKTTPHLNPGLCNRNSYRVAGGAYRLRCTAYAVVGCQIAIYPLGKVGGKFMHWPLLLPWLVLGLWRGSQNLGG